MFDSAYSTGELDKFTTRVERTATGSDIFITHRGMAEVYVGERKDATVWQPRPADPQLEGDIPVAPHGQARRQGGAARVDRRRRIRGAERAGTRARLVEGQPTPTLQLDDGFDRAWRRVGIALDRSGFTVEDRDRGQGLYFVRYVDPAFAGREEPNFFSRMFSFGARRTTTAALAKYRVKVNSRRNDDARSPCSIRRARPRPAQAGKRIVNLLLEDLR